MMLGVHIAGIQITQTSPNLLVQRLSAKLVVDYKKRLHLLPSAEKMPDVIFALTHHGGHLGFFEGAVLFPQPLTWMDKVIVEYTDAICHWEKGRPACQKSSRQHMNSFLQNTGVTLSG